jgi:hypothetical protein
MLTPMDGRTFIGAAVALTSWTLALSGCGGKDEPVKTTPARLPATGLQRPIFGRCIVQGFATPQITEITSRETAGRAWSLRSDKRTAVRGRVNVVLVVEFAPSAPLPKGQNPGTRKTMIAGHSVALRAPITGSAVYTAQWKTSKATYTAIIGSANQGIPPHPATVRQLVACLT